MGEHMDSIHGGHRERLRLRFLEHGLENFSDIEAIELLLCYAIPRRETNTLSHALLERFGSYRGVLEAEASELADVPGLGENAASLLTLVTALNRRYLAAGSEHGAVLRSSADAAQYLLPRFAYCREETAMMLTLDSVSRVIRCHRLADGGGSHVLLSSRTIVDLALRDAAAKVILAHNHVSGLALPSNTDIATTERIRSALQLIGVALIDHLIVADDDCVSMRDSGWMQEAQTDSP